MTSTTAGLISSAGVLPAERTWTRPRGVVIQQRGGHLGAPGVVDADEQDLGDFFHNLPSCLCRWGKSRSLAKLSVKT